MPHSKTRARSAGGSGTIRQKIVKRNGAEYTYWEARFTTGFDPATGKQKQRSITGKTQKEVAQKLRQATFEIDQGIYIEPSKMTVAQWADIWTEEYLVGVKPRTLELYQDHVRLYIKPGLGQVRLDALNPHTVQQFYNRMSKPRGSKPGLKPKTIKNLHGVLHKCLQQAVAVGYMRTNPADVCTFAPDRARRDPPPQ